MYPFFKRCFDIFVTILLMPFLALAILIIGFLIKLEDRGPIFYVGERIGKNGEIFKMYKFRTMKIQAPDVRNSDGSTFNSIDDPRLLRFGRIIRTLSLDELPQIINVFKGDMSIIGPRPDLPEMIDKYTEDERVKLKVRPGITGYSQAYFRNSIGQKEKFKQDIFYTLNYSSVLDIKIMLKTLNTVFLRKNVFKGSE